MTPQPTTPAAAKSGPRKRRVSRLEIMDTTLRDGEQTHGVSFTLDEKLNMAQRLLGRVKVDRIEVASCRVSPGEQKTLAAIMQWAREKEWENRVEVLSFTDYNLSVDWLLAAGCCRMNLLSKGSLRHCEQQLRKKPAEHRADVEKTLEYAVKKGVVVNIYLEDWSNGMIDSPDYVFEMLDHYTKWPFSRILLPDTLGVLAPDQVRGFLAQVLQRYPKNEFEFHGHNDYGLATANSLVAAQLGIDGIHCTVNGLGERAGNTSLEEVVAAIRDHGDRSLSIKDTELKGMSELVELFSGKRIADNKPICGRNVFTQTAGIHADGDRKGNLYASRLLPERFARDRVYALGKLAGRSNLDFNLDALNLTLTKEQRAAVLQRVVELGDSKHIVTQEDLPFIVADVLQTPSNNAFEVLNCHITSSLGLAPTSAIRFRYNQEEFEVHGTGSGGFDAFMNALRSVADRLDLKLPRLIDYEVHIPPGGKTDALVETTITWEGGLRTRALHSDQVMAAIQATERMINLMAQGVVAVNGNGHAHAKKASKASV